MFSVKFASLAFFVSLVAGLVINVPENPTSAGPVTITWTPEASDDVFSLYLVNEEFHDTFAIANNVNPADMSISLTLPIVNPVTGYQIRATALGNITDVFANSGTFSIAPASVTTSSSSTASASSTVVGSASTTASGISTSVSVTTVPSGSTTGPITRSNSVSRSGSASESAPSASSTPNSASGLVAGNAVSMAAAALAAVAGAAVFAL